MTARAIEILQEPEASAACRFTNHVDNYQEVRMTTVRPGCANFKLMNVLNPVAPRIWLQYAQCLFNWLLLRSDSVLDALGGVAQGVPRLLQHAAGAILRLRGLVGGSLRGVRGPLLRLLPLLAGSVSRLVGLIASRPCHPTGLVVRCARGVRRALLRLLPLLPRHVARVVALVTSRSCCLVRLALSSASGVLCAESTKKNLKTPHLLNTPENHNTRENLAQKKTSSKQENK